LQDYNPTPVKLWRGGAGSLNIKKKRITGHQETISYEENERKDRIANPVEGTEKGEGIRRLRQKGF